jgi:hypothetical protein
MASSVADYHPATRLDDPAPDRFALRGSDHQRDDLLLDLGRYRREDRRQSWSSCALQSVAILIP